MFYFFIFVILYMYAKAYIPPGVSFVLHWQLSPTKWSVYVMQMILPKFYTTFQSKWGKIWVLFDDHANSVFKW